MKKTSRIIGFTLYLLGMITASQSTLLLPTASAQSNRACGSSTDTSCLQSDNRYRCWDGSTIAIGPGQSCPDNPNDGGDSDTERACKTTGGQWTDGTSSTSGTCSCPGGGVFALSLGCPAVTLSSQELQSACESSGGTWSTNTSRCTCAEAGRVTAAGTCPEAECATDELDSSNCTIISYLVNGINFLSAVAGMAIVASIVIAGYQYMTARDNSGQVESAKKRMMWAIIALGVFVFMYAILNFLVPGGVL
jgi:hypothetical protein